MRKITLKSRSYLHLLIVLIAITMVMPLLGEEEDLFGNLIAVIFFIFFIITALETLSTREIAPKSHFITWLIRIAAAGAVLTDISQAILHTLAEKGGEGTDPWWLLAITFISLIGYATLIIILIIFILKDLFAGTRVTLDKLFGAITVYFLLGILWALLYHMPELFQPGSLIYMGGEEIKDNYPVLQYFSFTTLCTLGYGDIIPGTKLTMVLSNLEAIVGSLYLAILVARLVGLYTAQASRDKFNAVLRQMKKASAETREEYRAM